MELFDSLAGGNGNGGSGGTAKSGASRGKSGGAGSLLADRMQPAPRTHRERSLPNERRNTFRKFIGRSGFAEHETDISFEGQMLRKRWRKIEARG